MFTDKTENKPESMLSIVESLKEEPKKVMGQTQRLKMTGDLFLGKKELKNLKQTLKM